MENLESLDSYSVTLHTHDFKELETYNIYKIKFLNISSKLECSASDKSGEELCTFTLHPWKVDSAEEFYMIKNEMTAIFADLSADN